MSVQGQQPDGPCAPINFSELPDSGQVIYVIEYDFGAVKVGYTAKPRQRLHAHDRSARQLAVQVTRVWISPPHGNALMNERRLIRFCAARSERTTGASSGEYFSDVTFDQVCEYAYSLPFDAPMTTANEREEECPACDVSDSRPLSALALLHQVAHGELRVIDANGYDVSDTWTGPVNPNH